MFMPSTPASLMIQTSEISISGRSLQARHARLWQRYFCVTNHVANLNDQKDVLEQN